MREIEGGRGKGSVEKEAEREREEGDVNVDKIDETLFFIVIF
jgi:hypothetical protein